MAQMPRGEPFSVPDPLAGAWDAMVRLNRRLQAKNDPLAPQHSPAPLQGNRTVPAPRHAGSPAAGQSLSQPVSGSAPAIVSSGDAAAKHVRAMENGVAPIADLIGSHEGGSGSEAYDQIFQKKGGSWYPPATKKPTGLTIDEAISLGPSLARSNRSSAMGKYQFTTGTLKDLRRWMKLSGGETMNPELQDRMFRELLHRESYDDFLAGGMSPADLQKQLANRWDSLAVDERGLTKTGRKAAIDSKTIQDLLTAAQWNVSRQIDEGHLPASVGGWR